MKHGLLFLLSKSNSSIILLSPHLRLKLEPLASAFPLRVLHFRVELIALNITLCHPLLSISAQWNQYHNLEFQTFTFYRQLSHSTLVLICSSSCLRFEFVHGTRIVYINVPGNFKQAPISSRFKILQSLTYVCNILIVFISLQEKLIQFYSFHFEDGRKIIYGRKTL